MSVSSFARPGLLALLLLSLAGTALTGCASTVGNPGRADIVGAQIGNPLFGAFRIESRWGRQGWDHVLIVRKDDDVYPGLAPRRYDRVEFDGYGDGVLRMAEAETFCPEACARHYEIVVRLDEGTMEDGVRSGGLVARLTASGCDCPSLPVRVGPGYLADHLRAVRAYGRG
tara:strand:- start:227 stop:739 length:513 start_codon:yes stop_codon:yes gene_type:complete